jgi:hypothetical protein
MSGTSDLIRGLKEVDLPPSRKSEVDKILEKAKALNEIKFEVVSILIICSERVEPRHLPHSLTELN